jgi:hypothetical protein
MKRLIEPHRHLVKGPSQGFYLLDQGGLGFHREVAALWLKKLFNCSSVMLTKNAPWNWPWSSTSGA